MQSRRLPHTVALLVASATLSGCGDKLLRVSDSPVALHVRARGSDTPFAVNIGETLPLEALPVTTDSTVVGSAVAASWTSSDTTKLTITSDGVLHTRCVGQVTVSAVADIGRSISGKRPVIIGSGTTACAP